VALTTSTGAGDINRDTLKTDYAFPWNRENRSTQDWTSAWNITRNVRIWQSHDGAGGSFPQSDMAEYPAMSINPSTGVLQGSWIHPNENGMYTGDTSLTGRRVRDYDPPAETDVHYGNRLTAVFNHVGAAGSNPTGVGDSGGIAVYDGTGSSLDVLDGGIGYFAEKVWRSSTDHILDRFKNPHIVADGDRMHVSYYDRIDRSLKYWFGVSGITHAHDQVGSSAAPGHGEPYDGYTLYDRRWVNLDGYYNSYDAAVNGSSVPFVLEDYTAPATVPSEDMTMKTGVNAQYRYFRGTAGNYPGTWRYVSATSTWGSKFAVGQTIADGDVLFYTGTSQDNADNHTSTGNSATVYARVAGTIAARGINAAGQQSNNTWIPVVTLTADSQHLAYKITDDTDYVNYSYTDPSRVKPGDIIDVGQTIFKFGYDNGRATGSNAIPYNSPVRANVLAVAFPFAGDDTPDIDRYPFITIEKLPYTATPEAGGETYQADEYDYLDLKATPDMDCIGLINVRPGQIVKAGTPLFTHEGISDSADRYSDYFRAPYDMKILALHVTQGQELWLTGTNSTRHIYIPAVTYAPVSGVDTSNWKAYTPTSADRFVGDVLVIDEQTVAMGDALFKYGSSWSNRNSNTYTSPVAGVIGKVFIKGNTAWPVDEKVALFEFTPDPAGLPSSPPYSRVRDIGRPQNGTGATQAGTLADAGYHNAIALDNGDKPVIAYYDAKNQRLKVAWAGVSVPLAGADWTVDEITAANSRVGEFVSLKIHTDNTLHIAAKNGSNQLVYIRGTPKGGGGWTYSDPVVVDNAGSVGTWADISLDSGGNPWITYRENTGARNSVKMAYLPGGEAGYLIPANWETMAVPNRYDALDARLSIENYTGAWKAAIGYRAADKFRISYFIDQ
jgi:hypothetical protein